MRWFYRFKEINFYLKWRLASLSLGEGSLISQINPNLSANSLQKHFRKLDKFFRLAREIMVGIGHADDLHALALAL